MMKKIVLLSIICMLISPMVQAKKTKKLAKAAATVVANAVVNEAKKDKAEVKKTAKTESITKVATVLAAEAIVKSSKKGKPSTPKKTVKKELDVEALTEVADFNAKIQQGKLTVVKFYAPWCGYCVKMTPVFKEIAKKYTDTHMFYEVNTDTSKELAKKNNVRGIPVFKFFDKDGNKVGEFSGYVDQKTFEDKMNGFFAAK